MDMANKLVEQLTEKFNIEEFKDNYAEKLLKRIMEKSKGKKITPAKLKVVHKQSDNLMDMLKASLASKKTKTA
jgi:DNA end-binding protein Ku